jgi:hypothetical protein
MYLEIHQAETVSVQIAPLTVTEPWHFRQFYYGVDVQGRNPGVIIDMFCGWILEVSLCFAILSVSLLRPRASNNLVGMSETCSVLVCILFPISFEPLNMALF